MRLYYFPAPVPIQRVFITRNTIFTGTREARLDFLVKIAKGFLSAAELDDVVCSGVSRCFLALRRSLSAASRACHKFLFLPVVFFVLVVLVLLKLRIKSSGIPHILAYL